MKVYQTSPLVLRVCGAVLLLLAAACLLWTPSAWAQTEALVVANTSLSGDALSKQDIRAIFLGKKSAVAGQNVVIVTLAGGDVHKAFLKSVVGKTPSQFSSHWKKIVFTGKGKMPKSFKTEEELLAFVSNTKGGIGYVGAGASADSRVQGGRVKVLTVQE